MEQLHVLPSRTGMVNNSLTNQRTIVLFQLKKFRKEINLFSKGKNKKQVLNLYAAEINNQRRQMAKPKVKAARKADERTNVTSSDEDNPNGQHVGVANIRRDICMQAALIPNSPC
jgi:hypothetical protein